MKELETVVFYVAIVLGIIGKRVSFGSHVVIQRDVNKRFAYFRKVKEGGALEGHVIAKYLVHSELDCLHRCVLCDNCVSFNFQLLSPKSSRHACELNDVTQLSSGHALVYRDGSSYNEPMVVSNEGQENPSISRDGRQLPFASPVKVETSGTSPMTSLSSAASTITSPAVLTTSPMTSLGMTSLAALARSSSLTPLSTLAIPMTSSAILVDSTSPIMTSAISTTVLQESSSSFSLLPSSAAPQANCTNGWHRYRTGCIKFFITSKTKSAAKSHCAGFKTSNTDPGDLIKIPSRGDNDQVVSLAPQSGRYYIGLTDWATEGVYRWKGATDDATYFNWQTGHPQAYDIEKNRDCVVISTHSDNSYKKWSTVQCSNSWSFICECESACS